MSEEHDPRETLTGGAWLTDADVERIAAAVVRQMIAAGIVADPADSDAQLGLAIRQYRQWLARFEHRVAAQAAAARQAWRGNGGPEWAEEAAGGIVAPAADTHGERMLTEDRKQEIFLEVYAGLETKLFQAQLELAAQRHTAGPDLAATAARAAELQAMLDNLAATYPSYLVH